MLSESGQSTVVAKINYDISTINKAIMQHSRWLGEWNKKLICEQPISDEFMQSDAYKHCGFGLWYYGEHSHFTLEQDEFPRLEQLHKSIHESVRYIMLKATKKSAIAPQYYDSFIASEAAFTRSLVNLRDSLFGQLYSFDFLTGVYNRQAFYSLLDKEFARVERASSVSSIVMVDLDYFKKVNDQYGHQAGDKVLTYFAHYLKESLRSYDSIGRYGGEEFLLCLPDTSVDDAKVIMDRVREELAAQPIDIVGPKNQPLSINITASFGVSSISKGHPTSEAITSADLAMYEAKSAGRNQVSAYYYGAGSV